jgi:hypothetical protein
LLSEDVVVVASAAVASVEEVASATEAVEAAESPQAVQPSIIAAASSRANALFFMVISPLQISPEFVRSL